MKPIKVIVATPSPIDRSQLPKTLATCAGVTVVSQASDLSQTYTDSQAMKPDLVLMANEFVVAENFSRIKSLYYALGIRWITIDAAQTPGKSVFCEDGSVQIDPVILPRMNAAQLLNEIKAALSIRRQGPAPIDKALATQLHQSASNPRNKVVLIGASTGGVDALLSVLAGFPSDCPPTAIVQHTGQGFSDSLIRLLDRRCAPRVVAAEQGMTMTAGMVCVAGRTQGHLSLQSDGGLRCAITDGSAISGHKPSVDALFQSAVGFAPRIIAVLLTGMGRDGAAGLLDLRNAGAATIGQNEATSVVYGMPRVAWEIGAVQQQLALEKIGPEILRLCSEPAAASLHAK